MKIAFCGTHGTGKSTLLNHPYFTEHFPTYTFTDSIARKFPKGWNGKYRQFYVNSWYLCNHFYNKNFVSARSIFDTWAYTRLNCGLTFMFQTFNIGNKLIDYDYLFYIKPEFDLENDNFRPLDKHYQKEIDKEIKLLLDFYHINYYCLTGSVNERIDLIRSIISKRVD